MRTRHSTGGVRKQSGRWYGLWYESGVKKSKVLGFVSEMTKGEAREAVAKIAAGAKQESAGVLRFGQFVETTYFGYYLCRSPRMTSFCSVRVIQAKNAL